MLERTCAPLRGVVVSQESGLRDYHQAGQADGRIFDSLC